MEAAPPTYEKATLVDYWDIIARYVPSKDLCSAALVCHKWHTTFAPHLWGNPASHFGIENDRVYVALTRFKRTLQTARLFVRSLTHTLHLPPAHAEIYNGPHADWLKDILERLPNLQSLVARGLPFFDHAALQALRYEKPRFDQCRIPEGIVELPTSHGIALGTVAHGHPPFGLRLLDASRCPNVTARGLAQALKRFEGLLYLDLSFTYPARDAPVLEALRGFSDLQVLKLRGISLTDESLETLADAVGPTVRSLDVRNNQISDRGVRTLLEGCFSVQRAQMNTPGISSARDPTPSLLPYLGAEMLAIYQGENFEGYLRNAFTGSFVSRLAIEDAPKGGITHLYISGNDLTAEGASGLIRSSRLHVLDVGAVSSGLTRKSPTSHRRSEGDEVTMPGVEKLTPVLSKHAAEALTFLRIGHALVTKEALQQQNQADVIQGRVELADTAPPPRPADCVELDGSSVQQGAVELPTVTTPRAELAGDPMHIYVSPAVNDAQHEDEQSASANGPWRGSASAPEVVECVGTEMNRMEFLDPVSSVEKRTMDDHSLMTPSSLDEHTMSLPSPSPMQPSLTFSSQSTRSRTYSSLATERTARLNAHVAAGHSFHPAMLSHLSTLILTDVPPFAPNSDVADRIIGFIINCAAEAWLAKKQAKLDYSLPPGRKDHASALKHSADKIFGLKRLVLELASEEGTSRSSKASPWQHSATKSMTEDRDSEALWSAAETDFSFFGAEEECGLPNLDPGRVSHSLGSSEKEVSLGDANIMLNMHGSTTTRSVALKLDTVAQVSAFRKERKIAHQRNVAVGASHPETEGYWPGVVQVVRSGTWIHGDEDMDYYGNRYSYGGIYR